MTTQWEQLVQLRTLRQQRAARELAQQRQVAEEANRRAQAAQQELAQRQQASQALWRETIQAPGVLGVDTLRRTAAWSRVLDRELAAAHGAHQVAQQAARNETSRVDERLQRLGAARQQLERAQQSQTQVRRDLALVRELRQEQDVEEGLAQRWHPRAAGRN